MGLSNSRIPAYGLARTHYLITECLNGADSIAVKLRNALHLDLNAMHFSGVSLDYFIAIIFGLHSHVLSMDPRELLQGVIHCAIDRDVFLAQTSFPQDVFETFLRNRSISVDELRQQITGGILWDKERFVAVVESDSFATDFLALRKHPILDLENGKYLITDIQFLAELLFNGLFFEIFFSLNGKKREDFLSLWGRAFELYLWELLRYFYPIQSQILRVDIEFDNGQIDAFLDFGTYCVVFEFKFLLLLHHLKHSRAKDVLVRELRLKLLENEKGDAKALRQLNGAIEAIKNGAVETALKKEKALYPVVVVSEPSLESFGVNSFLNREFQTIRGSFVSNSHVKPLTVMSVDELEMLLPQAGAGYVTWQDLLESRFDGTRVRATSVHQALYDRLKTSGHKFNRNLFLEEHFERIYTIIADRYQF